MGNYSIGLQYYETKDANKALGKWYAQEFASLPPAEREAMRASLFGNKAQPTQNMSLKTVDSIDIVQNNTIKIVDKQAVGKKMVSIL